jgi:hypothetical protein
MSSSQRIVKNSIAAVMVLYGILVADVKITYLFRMLYLGINVQLVRTILRFSVFNKNRNVSSAVPG